MLASWDRAGTSSQTRSAEFLSAVAAWLDPLPAPPLTLDLVVGLPAAIPLASGGHDLDNYLFPIAHHLGNGRFVAAFASKSHAPSSTLALEPARPITDEPWRPKLRVRTSTSTDKIGSKQEIGGASVEHVNSLPSEGPVRLEVHYRLSSRRNWVNLWKPTIDALGPVLGVADPRRPFNVDDDRITDLCPSGASMTILGGESR